MTKIIRNTLRLPEKLHQELLTIADEHGSTLNGLIRQILWDWLKANGDRPTAPAEEQTKT